MRLWILGVAAIGLLGCGAGADASATGSTSSSAASSTGAGGAGTGGASASSSASSSGSTGGAGGQGGAGWGPAQCPPLPPGVKVGINEGDQLPDIVVKTCDGADYSLKELCGAQALWIFAAHGWCPLCQSVSSQADEIHDSFAGKGLASVNIVVADAQNNPPDAAYCALWRTQHNQQDVITLYDPTGAVLALWPGGSSSLSAFVDHQRIITGKLVHTSDTAMIKAGIQKALSN